ncbi:MAG: UDP-N-acetylmuramoyl-L-alanine--D-glutamate ligase [Myxococcota bacterium]
MADPWIHEKNPFQPTMGARLRVAEIREKLAAGDLSAAVVGGGKSGLAAAELLASRGASVCILDDKTLDPAALARVPGAKTGPIDAATLAEAELVVLSPGVPRARPELAAAIARGVVVGEIELASWFVRAPMVGITGTNGKSTTTALIAHILASARRKVFAGGNLGRPLSELAVSAEPVDVAVVELSSYQLESIVDCTFEAACWLNLTPDHTDRYPDLETYAFAKRRIIEARSIHGVAVLNASDPWAAHAGLRQGGPIRWFAAKPDSDLASRVGTTTGTSGHALRTDGGEIERYDLDNPYLPGLHNRSNMAAAIECARALGASPDEVQAGLHSFRGLPHRIELVSNAGGARWYNDSKATNIDSTITAVRAVTGPKILIAGGRDKGAPWDGLVDLVAPDLIAVLAVGEATPIVMKAFAGRAPVLEDVGTVERAVARAAELVRPGCAVLLSPACASLDQFKNYEVRGDLFRRLAQALETPASKEAP